MTDSLPIAWTPTDETWLARLSALALRWAHTHTATPNAHGTRPFRLRIPEEITADSLADNADLQRDHTGAVTSLVLNIPAIEERTTAHGRLWRVRTLSLRMTPNATGDRSLLTLD